jgi:hypothetical protein
LYRSQQVDFRYFWAARSTCCDVNVTSMVGTVTS